MNRFHNYRSIIYIHSNCQIHSYCCMIKWKSTKKTNNDLQKTSNDLQKTNNDLQKTNNDLQKTNNDLQNTTGNKRLSSTGDNSCVIEL